MFSHFWLPWLSHLTLKSSGFGEAEGELSGPERGVCSVEMVTLQGKAPSLVRVGEVTSGRRCQASLCLQLLWGQLRAVVSCISQRVGYGCSGCYQPIALLQNNSESVFLCQFEHSPCPFCLKTLSLFMWKVILNSSGTVWHCEEGDPSGSAVFLW